MSSARFHRHPVLFSLLAVAFSISACSSGQDSPEAQVRATIEQGEAAVKKKESIVLRRLVSEKYLDSQGQNKKAIEAVLRYYFLRNESIHLFTRVQQIDFPKPDIAQVILMVAMAGQPISSAEELEPLRADLHRFQVTLTRENEAWRVTSAEWRSAEAADFF